MIYVTCIFIFIRKDFLDEDPLVGFANIQRPAAFRSFPVGPSGTHAAHENKHSIIFCVCWDDSSRRIRMNGTSRAQDTYSISCPPICANGHVNNYFKIFSMFIIKTQFLHVRQRVSVTSMPCPSMFLSAFFLREFALPICFFIMFL